MHFTLLLLKKKHLEFLRKARNSPQINRYLFTDVHISKRDQEKWYQKYLKNKKYLIFVVQADCLIGYTQITHIDNANRSCEVGFCIAPGYQGEGYGKELVRKIVDYAFKKLNMHRVYLELFADNERAINLYKKCGFKKEGLLRDKILKRGKFRDVVIMSIIKVNA
ncbi:UDP-4-amino-4,6-dideoxy-N-acetyl-beta-L-altrosamine N-acetyltransferase [candidate division WOR-3 bacterium]|nr:UDP-4-amino-4,6-dideoxy-N-acetyl-beta-L-altrosamine N-acetyltransferase [candidate division WOR-3 bacterium]